MEIITIDPYATFIERDETWIKKAQELAKIKKTLTHLKAMEELLSAQLKELSNGVSSRGGGYTYICTIRKGSVDYTNIPQLKGVNLEQFRSQPIETWKLEMELK